MPKTWVAGEEITATNLNKTDPETDTRLTSAEGRISQAEYNIFELYLENYFAGKSTPYNGMIFDGFSDTTKADQTSTTLSAQANAAQAILTVGSTTGFKAGHNIAIYSGPQSSGPLYAGTVADDAGIGSIAWSGPTSAQGAGDSTCASATVTGAQITHYLKATNFGFNIPAGVTIKGILVEVKSAGDSESADNIVDYAVRIVKSGTIGSTDKSSRTSPNGWGGAGCAGSGFTSYGGSTDLWGETWTISDINSVNFGFAIAAKHGTVESGNNRTAFVDAIRITVYYENTNYEEKVVQSVDSGTQLTLTSNLANTYPSGSSVKRNTVTIDTTNKKITPTSNVGNGKKFNYFTKLNSFQQAMASSRLWMVRNWTARFNPASAVSAAATSLTIAGDQTTKFAVGDTIDIYSSDNLKRERKTLTAVSYSAPNTTLSWSGGLTNSYATSDYVERVDTLPKISIVDKNANESFAAMTYKKSIVDFTNNEVEDEYDYTPATPNEDVVLKLEMTRNDTALSPYAKRLGSTLNT
jgi:hypothetical protein